jgi:CheY-like chemotaxis protein
MVRAVREGWLLGRSTRPGRREAPRRSARPTQAIDAVALCFAEERRPPPKNGHDPVGQGGRALPVERHLTSVKERGARRVLVVDDEPSMRLLCSINLELAGFEVREAADGAEALVQALAGGLDLVLLDVMMPDIGGHEVLRRLSEDERTRGLPVVFLSARTDRDDLRAGYELGAVDYVTKPFDPIALAARVDEILGRVGRGEIESYRRARLAELE